MLRSSPKALFQLRRNTLARSCFVISGVGIETGNKTEVQMEEKVRELISKMLNVSQEDLDYEFDKVNRRPKKASDKNKKKTYQQSSANFGLISLGSIFSRKRREFTIASTVK